jgi:hypothetical protein
MQLKALAAAAALATTAFAATAAQIPIQPPPLNFIVPPGYIDGGSVDHTFQTGSPFEFSQLNTFDINAGTYPNGVFARIDLANWWAAGNTLERFNFTGWEFGSCAGVGCSIRTPLGLPESGKFGVLTGMVGTDNFSFVGFQPTVALGPGQYYVNFSGIAEGSATQKSMATVFNDVAVVAVPEPSTYALMLAGLGVVGWMARRRQPKANDRLAAA